MFLPREERDAAQILSDSFARDGIEVRLNAKAVGVSVEHGQKLVDLVSDDDKSTVAVDAILTGTGRVPNVDELEPGRRWREPTTTRSAFTSMISCGPATAASMPPVMPASRTSSPTPPTRPRALRFGTHYRLGRQRLSALVIPWCTYTDPEIAHVGLYVRQALERKIPVKTFTIPMHDVDRAITDDDEMGFVKIHVKERTDRILGATIVARHAGEMINEITLAMVAGIGLHTIAHTIHSYGTQADGIKMAADAFSRTRVSRAKPSLLRRWLER